MQKNGQCMPTLISQLFDLADQGIGLFTLDTLCLVECNSVLHGWLKLKGSSGLLSDHLDDKELTRLNKAIEKGRIFRIKKEIKVVSRIDNIDFKIQAITLSDKQGYLMVQGTVNNSERENHRIMKEYSMINEKNKKLLNEEKEKAQLANKAKSMFIATMSHELRTPLNGILGMAQKIQSTQLDADQNRYIQSLKSSGKQLLGIINEILDYSKIESNKLQLHLAQVDVIKLSQEVFEICSSGFEQKKAVELTVETPDGNVPLVLADDIRLKQILINILANAIKFTNKGFAKLKVNLVKQTPDSCEFRFVVTDSGIGMQQEKINGLFAAFTQHDASTTREYGGTGLGLTICNQLVELMNGHIEVTSEIGKGSEFDIRLGFTTVTAQEVQDSQEQDVFQVTDEQNDQLKGKTILIAEDTPINQEVIQMAFDGLGARLLMAHDGKEALDLFKTSEVDIVLMDCLMPVMDGFEATQNIRKLEASGQRVPILAITASTSDEINQRCRSAGMDDVMLKPFDFDALILKVSSWVEQ